MFQIMKCKKNITHCAWQEVFCETFYIHTYTSVVGGGSCTRVGAMHVHQKLAQFGQDLRHEAILWKLDVLPNHISKMSVLNTDHSKSRW
jgi:hypothetical protein